MIIEDGSLLRSPERPGVLDQIDGYWRSKCVDGGLPSIADINPTEFGAALGSVSLIDVLAEPLRFRFRLVASNIQARFEQSLSGTFLHDFPEPEKARLFQAVYRSVLKTRHPQSCLGKIAEGSDARLFRAMTWPMASDGSTIDLLRCCREPVTNDHGFEPDRTEDWEAQAP